MKIIVTNNQNIAGKKAFNILQTAIQNGATTLGLATGSTPLPLYQEMVQSKVDYSSFTAINLDEYVGLSPDNPQSYHYFMQHNLFNQKKFAKTYIPNGLATNTTQEINRYDHILAANPIDFQVLGIGRNGHIGFNEPGSPFNAHTRKVSLSSSTIAANARFFENSKEVPHYAYSMGLGSIMQSKEILLMAFGDAKSLAVQGMIEGPVTSKLPASILQRKKNVTVILDSPAAHLLNPDSIDLVIK